MDRPAERPVLAHTTDLSGDDSAAFVHAAALAAASGARLVTVHGNAPPETAARLPAAAPLAVRWSRSIDHERRCHECCDDVTDTILDALHELRPVLVVAGTHARRGLGAILHESVSEGLARNLDVPTLVVPNQSRGFVDEATGRIDLERILVPAADSEAAEVGVTAARELAALAGVAAPRIDVRVDHDVEAAAKDDRACLIVMPTADHRGLLDALLGSHTEHVIHAARCPVLVVPMPATGR